MRPVNDSKPTPAQPANTGRRRSRRHASSDESSSQTLPIDPSRVRKDPRTTLMIRNIPNR